MAFCGNCGTQLEDGVQVCPSCGTPLGGAQAGAVQTGAVPKAPRQPMSPATKKKLIIGLSAAAVAIIAAIVLIVVLVNRPKSFSIQDAVYITTDGYDTLGKLNITTDRDLIEMNMRNARSGLRENVIYEILNSIRVTPSSSDHLTNGQEITISVMANQQLLENNKLRLTETEWTYTVSGLQEIEAVDPFDGISLMCYGTSPFLYVDVDVTDYQGVYGALYYELDRYNDVAIGDSVTVTASYSGGEERLTERYGVVLKETTKTFTIEEADAYVTKMDELDSGALSAMQKEAQDVIDAYLAKLDYADDITYSDLTYEGCALLMGKNEMWSQQNRVWIVYSAVFSPAEDAEDCPLEEDSVNYFPICFYDVIRYQDGETDYGNRSSNVEGNSGLLYANDWWGQKLRGYADSADLMTEIIRKQTDNYSYELSGELESLY